MRVTPLQNQFSAGMRRDTPRNRMQPLTGWNLVDFVLDYGAPARERSGWAHYSSAASAATATASYIDAGIYVTFSPTAGADAQNLAIDEDGILYEIGSGTCSLIGQTHNVAQNPVFHGGTAATAATAVYTGLVIIPDADGAAVPKLYDGTTIKDMGGTPPMARYATVYRDYTVLGNGTVSGTQYPNRIWFSPPGDPDVAVSGAVTAWDTTDSWIDFSLPIGSLASTKAALLSFHDGQITRVRGSIPPPGEDMVVDDPWQQIGFLDPKGIAVYQDQVFWVAPEGVYRTDGVYLDDLTLKGGMLRYWLDLVADSTSTWTFALGIIRNKVVITVMDGTTFKDAFMIDLNSYAWTRLSNLDAITFWSGQLNTADETFFGRRGDSRVGRLGTIFEVGDSTYKNDGDGDAVVSVLETPFYEFGRPGFKTVKALHVGYELNDYATDNPTVAVSYITSPEETSYTALSTLSETTSVYDRQRVSIGGRMYGVGFKFQRANAGDFLGYDLTAEVAFQEDSKRLR